MTQSTDKPAVRQITAHLSIGLQADRREEIEVADDATTEDINDAVREWANNYIEYSWEEKP